MLKKTFKLEKTIYSEDFIKSAIKDFTGFVISYEKWQLTISGENSEEIDEIFNELMNYILWIYNESI